MKKQLIVFGTLVGVSAVVTYSYLRVLERPYQPEDWLAAVQRNDQSQAIEAAIDLVELNVYSQYANEAYLPFFESENVTRNFLTDIFNEFDFQLWQDALFFQQLARELTAGRDDQIRALFDAVTGRISAQTGDSLGLVQWPRRIWEQKWGPGDHHAWVLCELAYQLGYETQITYLRDPENQVAPHTIAEIRRGNRVWLVDPFEGKFLPNVSIDDLAADLELPKQTRPAPPAWWHAVKNAAMYTPAYPSDYTARNQRLYEILHAQLGDACPRFGEDPLVRRERYLALRGKEPNDRKLVPIAPWSLPLCRLHESVGMNQRGGQEKR